jgi:hypothetical protein
MKNDLVANSTMFLKRRIEGEVVPNEWGVRFFFGPRENRIRKGWGIFLKENNLNVGDKCMFRLVSKDTFVVEKQGSFNSIGGKRKYLNGKVKGVSSGENRPSSQKRNVHMEKMVGSSCEGTPYIEIEDLSESDNGTIGRVSDGELASNFLCGAFCAYIE